MPKRAFSPIAFIREHTNAVIRFLILGDVIFYSAIGLLGPIFAIFIIEYIEGGTIVVAGIATAILLVTRSLVQIPAARIIDKVCGDKDDFWFMFGGLFVASLVPLFYLIVKTPMELYLVQFIYGIAMAFNWPSFYALFTKYIPQSKEATAWSLYQTSIDLGAALTAALGGWLAATLGFQIVIVGVVVFALIGTFAQFPIRKLLKTYNC